MPTKKINIFTYSIFGVSLIFLGYLIFQSGEESLKRTFEIVTIIFFALAAFDFLKFVIEFFTKKSAKMVIHLQNVLVNVGTGFLILNLGRFDKFLLGIICACYALSIGTIKIVNYLLFVKNERKWKLIDMISCLIYVSVGLLIFISPARYTDQIMQWIAIWVIIYGVFYLIYGLSELVGDKQKDSLKKKIRLPLPVLVAAIIPELVLKRINKAVEVAPTDLDEIRKTDATPDLEVFIHMSPNGFNRMGHVDIFYKNKIISYGNYDKTSERFFTMVGDGILFFANKEKYIPFVMRESQKTLVSFGLNLNKDQLRAIDDKLARIEEDVYRWKVEEGTDSYPQKLQKNAQAKLYKFNKGKFKTYFVLGTNCVLLADELIGSSGLDIVKMNGIITPGSYYDCLDREFLSRRNLVISKKIYR